MPSGTYLHLDPLDGSVRAVERFSCAPGPAGWRYVGDLREPTSGDELGRVDLAVDTRWRPARLELRAGGWIVRGGAAGADVLWVRSGQSDAEEHSARTPAFTGLSPAFLVATAHMLALEPGQSRSVELTRFSPGALGATTVRQQWHLTGETEHPADTGTLVASHFRLSDLDTGEAADVHISGDVVLAAPLTELDSLEGPPNTVRRHQPG